MARVFLLGFFDEYSLGLRYISASLKEAGHEVRLGFLGLLHQCYIQPLDTKDESRVGETQFPVQTEELELVLAEIERFAPDIVGISLVSCMFGLAEVSTRLVRERLNLPVVWGGVEPTISPDLAQEHADVICVGEGEKAIVELASHVPSSAESRGTEWLESISEPIPNLRIRQKNGWLRSDEGLMVQDLDSLQFPLLERSNEVYIYNEQVYRGEYPPNCRFPNTLPVISARGCPFHCSYCVNSVLKRTYQGGKYLRRRSVENVMEELRLRKRQFPEWQALDVEDDVFTLDGKWIEKFAGLYGEDIRVPFWCYTFPGRADERILARLKEVGLMSVTFGVQSGSVRVLREVYDRKTTPEQILETAQLLFRMGIPYVADLIGSNPLETDEDRILTAKLLGSMPKPYLLHPINPMTFYAHYPITLKAQEEHVALEQSPGTTKYGALENPRYRAWDAIHTLAQYPGIDEDTLRVLWEDEALMNAPEALEKIANAIAQAVYYKGDIYLTKDKKIEQLQNELNSLRGSRLVRAAIRLRDSLR